MRERGGRCLIRAVLGVRKNTSRGVVMLKVCGKVVYVKAEKNEKNGRHFKRLQLLSNGGAGRAVLHDVTDMANDNWAFGSEVEIPCSIDVYQGKRGISYSLTHWGKQGGDSGVVAGPAPGDPAATAGAVKSGGKFGG